MDFEESAVLHRTVVHAGVDEELDKLKRAYDGLENLLNEVSRNINASIPEHINANLNVIFFPQIGFLITMPINRGTRRAEYEGQADERDAWEFMFNSSGTAYYKDSRMRELDETWGDVYALICGIMSPENSKAKILIGGRHGD